MKTMITTKRFDPDTISGEKFQIIYTYTTFDKIEMDAFEAEIKKHTNGAYAIVINDEDDLKCQEKNEKRLLHISKAIEN